jgi:predicted RNA-binding Zn-ribbon protein involved in translation (DUF1610 family)
METLDSITPEQWNKFSKDEKINFNNYWIIQGVVSFLCLNCGYPTVRGQSRCVACREDP